MPDRENVIKELTNLPTTIYSGCYQLRITHDLRNKVIALLKEQEAQKFFVDESGKITPLPVVVRCKDCKHWYFADNRIPSEQENVCGRNGIVVTPDWFCADGERK